MNGKPTSLIFFLNTVSGVPAYDEETWKKARFKPGKSGLHNDAVFHISCRTVRYVPSHRFELDTHPFITYTQN